MSKNKEFLSLTQMFSKIETWMNIFFIYLLDKALSIITILTY